MYQDPAHFVAQGNEFAIGRSHYNSKPCQLFITIKHLTIICLLDARHQNLIIICDALH